MFIAVASLTYERMCIMFNMAAMQSTIAAQQSLDTEDSLKLAAKLLQVVFITLSGLLIKKYFHHFGDDHVNFE